MDIINPHDKFFKDTFSDKEAATDFFKQTIPPDLITKIDFATLDFDSNSYIDEELKEYFSDIVYNCTYSSSIPVKIVLLFEHKSYVPEYLHLQLLKYLLKIWETGIKQDKKLIPVIPLIYYHGKERWEIKPFCNYFTEIDEKLKHFIPELNYLLTDLSSFTDEELMNGIFNNVSTKISSLLMKNIFNEEKLLKNLFDFLNIGELYLKRRKD